MNVSEKITTEPKNLNFEIVLKKNINLFSKNLKDEEMLEIFVRVALENYGELNFKKTLLATTKVHETVFKESVEEGKIQKYQIDTYTLYSVEDFSYLLYRAYRREIWTSL